MRRIIITTVCAAYAASVVASFGGMNSTAHSNQCLDHYALYDKGKVIADTALITTISAIPVLNVPVAAWLTDGFGWGISFHVTSNCDDVGGKA